MQPEILKITRMSLNALYHLQITIIDFIIIKSHQNYYDRSEL